MNRGPSDAARGDEQRDELDPAQRAVAEALAEALAAALDRSEHAPSQPPQPQPAPESATQATRHALELAAWGRRAAGLVRAQDGAHADDAAGDGAGERMLAAVRARLAAEPGALPPPIPRLTVLQLVARSPLLRLVAASLVAHLAALPVLAWFTFRPEPERRLTVYIEPPEDPAEVFAPRREVLDPANASWEWEQRRRLERFALTRANRGGALEILRPLADERSQAVAAGDWHAALAARIDLWLGGGADAAEGAGAVLPTGAEMATLAEMDGESASLWLGLALDRALLARDDAALVALETELDALAARPDPRPLAAALVSRARALGLRAGPAGWPPPEHRPFDPAPLLDRVAEAWPEEALDFGPIVRWRAAAPR
ncbi:MAG: hypothetical protein GC161_09640 [Planctomycetaceae bacterium]|nr:hypothetical protein [Planctomycetaceae bacterium]